MVRPCRTERRRLESDMTLSNGHIFRVKAQPGFASTAMMVGGLSGALWVAILMTVLG
jgi:hypothetical protein